MIESGVLEFVTGKIVNKMANDGLEEVRVSALAYMLRYDKRTLDKHTEGDYEITHENFSPGPTGSGT